MSSVDPTHTFLGMPGYGKQSQYAGRALWRAAADMDRVHVSQQVGSLLAHNFNALWCEALNLQHVDGQRIDYFAMLHDDVGAPDGWLDTLIAELEAHDLDLLGVAVPIKDARGLTSLALHEAGNNWMPQCRLSMHDLYRLPPTFTSADVGKPLLLNTGCWVCRFDPAWNTQVHFTINDRIAFNKASGRYQAVNESEDWFFSRLAHELQLKIGATRKVPVLHTGETHYTNTVPWGAQPFDADSTDRSPVPDIDRDGFRDPHDVDGWLSYDEGKALWELARGKKVLEIGAYCGKSTICLAQSAKVVVSVDPHDGRGTPQPRDTFAEFERNLARYGVEAVVQPFVGTAGEFAAQHPQPSTLNPQLSFDLIFIDAAHDADSVRADIAVALPLLAVGGLLAFHDYHRPVDPGVTAAVDELLAAGGELLSTTETVAVVKPPSHSLLEV